MEQSSPEIIEHKIFAPSELIPLDADFYWLLQQGVVKTCTWTQEGNPISLGYWGAGDLVGQPLSLVYPYQIRCVTKVKALRIHVSQSHNLTDSIHHHIQQTEELLFIVRSEKMYQRLRQTLIWLANKFGTKMEIGQLIDLRITHQDLAEIIGSTRVTVTKLINQLEQEGFLSRPERNAIVLCLP
ncbi:Crp/Fnr family transcriptional regulator [Pleurocapsa sp. PCC 7319]|uniref:Crp/Fnr family transcriptional regulator n=1 Tax=Pleurocapsa sp. PCC 7319 TaxID=118161 RepID=UPI00034527B8|nr:Crp/Fnr family transcriptional regulator [Pleurocapsa sp. PCC 7319]